MFQRRLAFAAGEHAGDFVHTRLSTHLIDGGGDGSVIRFTFGDHILFVRPGGDLW